MSDACKIYFEFVEARMEPSESIFLENGSISFIKTSPSLYEGAITYNFTELDFELKVPLRAIVCGFEKIVPRSGVSVIGLQLNKED
jgi:hypothetical protein